MTNQDKEKEQLFLEQERKRVPHLFDIDPMIDSKEFLEWIGIEGVFQEYPLGHLKYMPQDFIVEEVAQDKTVSTVDVKPSTTDVAGVGSTIYTEFVKVDMTTLKVKEELAKQLGIEFKDIGTAGLKDEIAITSQKVSLRKVKDLQKLLDLKNENFFIKNIVRGKDIIKKGQLLGNRFTITIRLPQNLTDKEKARIEDNLQDVSEQGFWNFFSFQRFAAPRFNGHVIGKHLLRREYEEALKNLLFYTTKRELPYFQNIRKEMEDHWGDWKAIQDKMQLFPSQFPTELEALDYLVKHPNDLLGALRSIQEQVRLWVYAYASFLFNKKLSRCIAKGEAPTQLPFVTSREPRDWEPYKDFLKEDGINLSNPLYRDFQFLWSRGISSGAPTLQNVEIHNVRFFDKMMVIAFSLPKGAYATTFLAHFFQLSSEAPVPQGIDTTAIDAKEVIGSGSLAPVIERFQSVLSRVERRREVYKK